MSDIVYGPVTGIIDDDTFDMEITHVGQHNEEIYRNPERVRIAGIDDPDLCSGVSRRSRKKLEKKLKDKEVKCYVLTRDTADRIVAVVNICN